ncbi:MAG: ribonuclease Z [Endomicrobiales bacterium]
MKISFLGTNGWYDTDTGNTVCALIQTKNEHIVLDCGTGFYKLDRYIKDEKPVYLFLSHFHFDHVFGLHALNRFDFPQGIHMYGPRGIKKFIGALIRGPYTMPLGKLRTRVTLHDLSETRPPVSVEFKKLKHPSLCYGYRFTLDGKVVTYCTDTGMTENIISLAKNADLFISECAFKAGQTSPKWGHMNPELAAAAAKEAGAKKLCLMHFDAALYTSKKDRLAAEKKARGIFGKSFAAFDDMKLTV